VCNHSPTVSPGACVSHHAHLLEQHLCRPHRVRGIHYDGIIAALFTILDKSVYCHSHTEHTYVRWLLMYIL
jgi:hypothetical protein